MDVQQEADQHYQSRFREIERYLTLLNQAERLGHGVWVEEIRERIEEMPLSVECVAIYPHREICSWEILLGTGGPADRVLVTTDFDGEVEDATYQFQDWGTLWTDAHGQAYDSVMAFAQVFYFRELRDVVATLIPGVLA